MIAGYFRTRSFWRSFRRAEASACCRAMRQARDQWDIAWLEITFAGRGIKRVEIRYCPKCGRKL